jgi:hypothetical protein
MAASLSSGFFTVSLQEVEIQSRSMTYLDAISSNTQSEGATPTGSAPGWIRTNDLPRTSRALYTSLKDSAELRGHEPVGVAIPTLRWLPDGV